jgi:hypothetical protein
VMDDGPLQRDIKWRGLMVVGRHGARRVDAVGALHLLTSLERTIPPWNRLLPHKYYMWRRFNSTKKIPVSL